MLEHAEHIPSKTYFCVPFQPNPRFAGRNEFLEGLVEKLFGPDSCQRVAIWGLGGIGKTQVALRLAYWVKENRPDHSVFWVPALSYAMFEQAYAEILKVTGVQRSGEEDPKETVQTYLSSKAAGKWLLVVDNADDPEILFGSSEQRASIHDYLPTSDCGRILFTTRTVKVAVSVAESNSMELPAMTIEGAKAFFLNSLLQRDQVKDNTALDDLLRELTYLPLAIRQASAYMNENSSDIPEYFTLFRHENQKNKTELMGSEFQDRTRYDGPNAIATSWHMSFNQIQNSDENAIQLLSFIACIEPKAIPRPMLPAMGSQQRLTRAIGTLLGYGFLSKLEGGKAFDMHSLVHTATRVWVDEQEVAQQTKHDAINHVLDVFPTVDWGNCATWQLYLPHAIEALDVGKDIESEKRCNLGYMVARCLKTDGRITELITQLGRVVDIGKRALPEDHPGLIAPQHGLAGAYLANGQVFEAIKLLEHVITAQRPLPEDHPDQLASQHVLAGAYLANGQVFDAIKLLEHVVVMREKTLRENDYKLLASQSLLAQAYIHSDKFYDTIKLLKMSWQLRRIS